MGKIITPNRLDKKNEEVVAPSAKTLDFIKQFAHTYHVEKSLPKPINGFCTN
ncbi:MAG: hypothetical protein E6767_01330 [Dysgonomonas sp.]|nr:hypothetical protein [Dysgonomonas sp.]